MGLTKDRINQINKAITDLKDFNSGKYTFLDKTTYDLVIQLLEKHLSQELKLGSKDNTGRKEFLKWWRGKEI